MIKTANVTGSLVSYITGTGWAHAFGVEKVATILTAIELDKKYITLTSYPCKYDEDNNLRVCKEVIHIMVSKITRIEEETREQCFEIRENGIETGKMVEVAPGVFERTGEETKQGGRYRQWIKTVNGTHQFKSCMTLPKSTETQMFPAKKN